MKMLKQYPDGRIYAVVYNNDEHHYHTINTSVTNYSELWQLGLILETMTKDCNKPNASQHPIVVNLAYLIDNQSDYRDIDSSFGLPMVLDFLSQFPVNYQLVCPHNPKFIEAYTHNRGKAKWTMAIVTIFEEVIYNKLKGKEVLVITPNTVIYDRFNKAYGIHTCDTISASKLEGYDEGFPFIKPYINIPGSINKYDAILVIDDQISYGHNLYELTKNIKIELGDNTVPIYACVPNITVNPEENEYLDIFEKIFTSNAVFDQYNISKIEIVETYKKDIKYIK